MIVDSFELQGRRGRTSDIAVALALGALIVFGANVATDVVLDKGLRFPPGSIDALDVALMHWIIAAFPMLVLARRSNRYQPLWIAAFSLTCAFWGYSIWQIWQDSLSGFAGGANIGLGLIMLASPFVVHMFLRLLALFMKRKW